jgi:hypothetical protein
MCVIFVTEFFQLKTPVRQGPAKNAEGVENAVRIEMNGIFFSYGEADVQSAIWLQ